MNYKWTYSYLMCQGEDLQTGCKYLLIIFTYVDSGLKYFEYLLFHHWFNLHSIVYIEILHM